MIIQRVKCTSTILESLYCKTVVSRGVGNVSKIVVLRVRLSSTIFERPAHNAVISRGQFRSELTLNNVQQRQVRCVGAGRNSQTAAVHSFHLVNLAGELTFANFDLHCVLFAFGAWQVEMLKTPLAAKLTKYNDCTTDF